MPEERPCIVFLFLLLFLVCSRGRERSLFRNVDCGAAKGAVGWEAEDKDEDRGARCLERGSTDARVKSSFVNLTMHFFSLFYYYYLLYQDALCYCTVC